MPVIIHRPRSIDIYICYVLKNYSLSGVQYVRTNFSEELATSIFKVEVWRSASTLKIPLKRYYISTELHSISPENCYLRIYGLENRRRRMGPFCDDL
jgi:hypothetical protein